MSRWKLTVSLLACTSFILCRASAEEPNLENLPEPVAEEILNSYQNQINATNPDATNNEIERLAHAFTLSSSQQRGLKRLLTDFSSCHFAFDTTSGIPRHITNLNFIVAADNALDAASAFLEKYEIAIAEILNQQDTSSLIWGTPPMLAREQGAVPRAWVRLVRTLSDIPVDDDGITISLIKDERGRWVVTGLDVTWTSGLPEFVDASALIGTDALEASIESNLLGYSKYNIVVGTRYPEIKGRLVAVVEGESLSGATITFLDAKSGILLKSVPNEQNYDYSGVLKVPATVPYETSEFPKSCITTPSTNCHPLPYATIYDSSVWQPYQAVVDEIYGSVITEDTVYTGTATTRLGTTDYDGNFTISGASGNIYVDQNKAYIYAGNTTLSLYVFDNSNKAQGLEGDAGRCRDSAGVLYDCSAAYFSTPISVNTSQTEQYAEQTLAFYNSIPEFMKIRQEIFFHLNYAAYNFDYWGVPVFTPVTFRWHRGSGVDDGVCGGDTTGGSIRYSCGKLYDDNAGSDNCKEIQFREVLFHEYGHTAVNEMGTYMPDGYYGYKNVYHEAASTISEILLSQFESTRGIREETYILGANRKWPMAGQDDNSIYFRAGVFTSIFLDLALATGYLSVVPIYDSFQGTPTGTVMVGQCQSVTDSSTCPGNSYYQRVIAAARNAWGGAPWWRQDYEISKAFFNHIEDAVPYANEPRCGHGCECDLVCEDGDSTCDPDYDPDCTTPPCDTTCDAGSVISPPECPVDCETALFIDPAEMADKDDFPMFDDVTDQSFAAAFVNEDVPSVSSSTNSFGLIRYTPDPVPKATKDQQLWFTNAYDYDVFSTYLRSGITYIFYGYGTGTIPCITLLRENRNWLARSSGAI